MISQERKDQLKSEGEEGELQHNIHRYNFACLEQKIFPLVAAIYIVGMLSFSLYQVGPALLSPSPLEARLYSLIIITVFQAALGQCIKFEAIFGPQLLMANISCKSMLGARSLAYRSCRAITALAATPAA